MNDQISVCICTYRRNTLLERLLRKLAYQETADFFDFSVIVIDNDAAGSAREIVMRLNDELGLDIQYAIEPERTIPAARNHALLLAKGNYIAIIDDDEFPSPQWLTNMYRAIQTFDADGALGPVHPYFESTPPKWLIRGKFCERPVYRTGTFLQWHQTRTGNVLLKKMVFDEHGLKFDLKWKTSGSDRALFKQAMQMGYRFIAVEEAPVYETVPPERWKKGYYLKRALVHGYNSYRSTKDDLKGISRVTVPAKSFAALIFYALSIPVSFLLGAHILIKCLEGGGHHLSQLLARLGIELVKQRNF